MAKTQEMAQRPSTDPRRPGSRPRARLNGLANPATRSHRPPTSSKTPMASGSCSTCPVSRRTASRSRRTAASW
jgi:hypothetical protein